MLTIVPKMRSFRPKWYVKAYKFGIRIAQKYWVYGKSISDDDKREES